jgi:hypothetical protein
MDRSREVSMTVDRGKGVKETTGPVSAFSFLRVPERKKRVFERP